MDIAELFRGIVVIIDDEIDNENSGIGQIMSIIQRRNMPVVTYKAIPSTKVIPALADASFIIVDWDYTQGTINLGTETDERVTMPQALKEDEEKIVVDFLTVVNETIFVPVFLFTSKSIEDIKEKLTEAGLWQVDESRNRIFIRSKTDLTTETGLFGAIEIWLKSMASAYVLKEWERHARTAKNTMFLDLYRQSPKWVEILWQLMKRDSIEYQYEFGEFLSRSHCNRMESYMFDETIIDGKTPTPNQAMSVEEQNAVETDSQNEKIAAEELMRVLEGERFIRYDQDKLPEQNYTGDLFIKDKTYYLNIRAQCDLSRKSNGVYDPQLYLIKGRKLKDCDILTEAIRLTPDCNLIFGSNKKVLIKEIENVCSDESELTKINKQFQTHRDKAFLRYGSFIERANQVIIGCVAGEKSLQFDLALNVMTRQELQDEGAVLIGRLLPPYITRIQQRCVQYIVREGVMPVPEELYI